MSLFKKPKALATVMLSALYLSACASVQHDNSFNERAVAQKIVNPFVIDTLLNIDVGQSTDLVDAPWQGYRATKMRVYTAASGRQCMQVKLVSIESNQMALFCKLPNQNWVESAYLQS